MFYLLKGVIWLGLGLVVILALGLGLQINIILPELHSCILHLGQFFQYSDVKLLIPYCGPILLLEAMILKVPPKI
jgi:hypothetical protein